MNVVILYLQRSLARVLSVCGGYHQLCAAGGNQLSLKIADLQVLTKQPKIFKVTVYYSVA